MDSYAVIKRDGRKGFFALNGRVSMVWGQWSRQYALVRPPFKANLRRYGRR